MLQPYLFGCSNLPFRQNPPEVGEIEITPQNHNQIDPDIPAWWHLLGSRQLDNLIHQALEQNPTIHQSLTRIEQTRTALLRSQSDKLPSLDLQAGTSIQRGKTKSEAYSAGLAASYELDLWNRRNAVTESARHDSLASVLDARTAKLSLSAEIAGSWIRIQYQHRRHNLLKQLYNLGEKHIFLIRTQFSNGLGRAGDILTQLKNQETIQSRIDMLTTDMEIEYQNLSTLCGQPADSIKSIHIESLTIPDTPPETASWKELLNSRPDIQASWQRVRSAEWSATAAERARYPTFSLSAAVENTSDTLAELLDDWLWKLAGNLIMPLIDGDSRLLAQKQQEAIADERLWQYRQTVLEAIADLTQAWSREMLQHQQLKLNHQQLTLTRLQKEQAAASFQYGETTLIPALSQHSALLEQQLTTLSSTRDLMLARISLIRAAGGALVTSFGEPQ